MSATVLTKYITNTLKGRAAAVQSGMGLSAEDFLKFCNGEVHITAEQAVLFGSLTGTKPVTLLNYQSDADLAKLGANIEKTADKPVKQKPVREPARGCSRMVNPTDRSTGIGSKGGSRVL